MCRRVVETTGNELFFRSFLVTLLVGRKGDLSSDDDGDGLCHNDNNRQHKSKPSKPIQQTKQFTYKVYNL